MIIVRSPFRVSFFGGSTDYESFYKENGSFLIGTTIDKYAYLCMKKRSPILPDENILIYSKLEKPKRIEDIQQPLIRNVLQFYKVKDYIEFTSFSDIPYRTGLGGSSSYCAGMSRLISELNNLNLSKEQVAKDSIFIERNLMKDPGGIQDQIWAAYGGLNSIKIDTSGNFEVTPLPASLYFKKKFQKSLVLIYTNNQRTENKIASSHDNKDKTAILQMAHEAYKYFINENIKDFGKLMFESWLEKRSISSLISSPRIDSIIEDVMSKGAYGAKLLGSGGCGFVLAVCDSKSKKKITDAYSDIIMDFNIENDGAIILYKQ
jgi:D-glycero-alpha-D-manno-heptose-7-phosphate kinase|tara:strand:- start:752 stop:1708 length:957 start_codon:yes stop_codon:yes gene_type:complete